MADQDNVLRELEAQNVNKGTEDQGEESCVVIRHRGVEGEIDGE